MKTGADEVFLVDTEELVIDSLDPEHELTPNKEGWGDFEELPDLEDIYGGYSRFLVRTALVRSKEWSMKKAPKITSPESAMRLVQHLLYADQEHIVLLCLNSKPQLVAIHETAIGTADRASVVVRDLVKVPLLVGAPAVIMCHNHPGGTPQFSPEDIEMTKAAKKAFDCVGVTLLDHILMARPALSFMNEYGKI